MACPAWLNTCEVLGRLGWRRPRGGGGLIEDRLTVVHGGAFVVGERDGSEHALHILLGLERLGVRAALGRVEAALGAGHVGPRLADGGGARGDSVRVDEDLDGADVPPELAGISVGLGDALGAILA